MFPKKSEATQHAFEVELEWNFHKIIRFLHVLKVFCWCCFLAELKGSTLRLVYLISCKMLQHLYKKRTYVIGKNYKCTLAQQNKRIVFIFNKENVKMLTTKRFKPLFFAYCQNFRMLCKIHKIFRYLCIIFLVAPLSI